jgi:hypothetical protein
VSLCIRNVQRKAEISEAVALVSGKDLPAHTHGAKLSQVQFIPAGLQVVENKRIVEIDIVRNENTVLQQVKNMGGDFVETGRIQQHIIRNAGKRGYISRQGFPGIHQGLVTAFLFHPIVQDDRNFRNPVGRRVSAGGFNIYDRIHGVKLRLGSIKKASLSACGE